MRIRTIIEFDEVTKLYAAYCPELPGCASCGKTEKEALANIKEAVALYLEPTPLKLEETAKETEIIL